MALKATKIKYNPILMLHNNFKDFFLNSRYLKRQQLSKEDKILGIKLKDFWVWLSKVYQVHNLNYYWWLR